MEVLTNNYNKLKHDNFSVLLIWSEGCPACQKAKPEYEALESKFSDFDFYNMPLSPETLEFYEQYEEPKKVQIPAEDEDGDPIVNAQGKPMMRTVERIVRTVPKYYVFHGSESTEDNEYGLLGIVEGHNLVQLEAILTNLEGMVKDEQAS